MGATDELLAARWHAALTVAQGPNSNDLEAVVKLITGIPFASAITRGLGLDAACRFRPPIRCLGSSNIGNYGLRLRDATNSKEHLLQQINNELNLYENTGTEATPVWSLLGAILPLVFTEPIRCLGDDTPGSNGIRLRDSTNSKEFLLQQINNELNLYENTGTEATPVWSLLGAIPHGAPVAPTGAAVLTPYGNQDFRSTGANVDFATERFDDSSFWSTAARSRLIVPSDGRYRFSFQVYIESPGSVVVIQLMAYLKVNGVPVSNTHQAAIIRNIQVGAPGLGVSGGVVYDGVSANDYFEVFCLTVGGTPYDGTLTEASFSVEKVV